MNSAQSVIRCFCRRPPAAASTAVVVVVVVVAFRTICARPAHGRPADPGQSAQVRPGRGQAIVWQEGNSPALQVLRQEEEEIQEVWVPQ